MGGVVVRRAAPDDVAELAAMRQAFTDEDPPDGDRRTDYLEAFAEVVETGLREGTWIVWSKTC